MPPQSYNGAVWSTPLIRTINLFAIIFRVEMIRIIFGSVEKYWDNFYGCLRESRDEYCHSCEAVPDRWSAESLCCADFALDLLVSFWQTIRDVISYWLNGRAYLISRGSISLSLTNQWGHYRSCLLMVWLTVSVRQTVVRERVNPFATCLLSCCPMNHTKKTDLILRQGYC